MGTFPNKVFTIKTQLTEREVREKLTELTRKDKGGYLPKLFGFFRRPRSRKHYGTFEGEDFSIYTDYNIPNWGFLTGWFVRLIEETPPKITGKLIVYNVNKVDVEVSMLSPLSFWLVYFFGVARSIYKTIDRVKDEPPLVIISNILFLLAIVIFVVLFAKGLFKKYELFLTEYFQNK